MPYLEAVQSIGKKRKLTEHRSSTGSNGKRKVGGINDESTEAKILQLESQLTESRKHYNNISTLLTFARDEKDCGTAVLALVALCRVFCRLAASGDLLVAETTEETEQLIQKWLNERYREYTDLLIEILGTSHPTIQDTTLTLLMRLVKEEVVREQSEDDTGWNTGLFGNMLRSLLSSGAESDLVRHEFVEKYLMEYDDIRFFFLRNIPNLSINDRCTSQERHKVVTNVLSMLTSIEHVPLSKDDLSRFYGGSPTNPKSKLLNLNTHKKLAQEAWLHVLRSGLEKHQRKDVLRVLTHKVAPWFLRAERLMDFLTDSYNVGGATSLLALSGLFYLMQERNLDYPSFYPKLYSLLNDNLLQSKHRSRFFRLLDTFMGSTHLPAALVASFIKRLSRLALNGPPAGIVVVVPWIYNLLKKHPSCTFMIHRETRTTEERNMLEAEGLQDPFNMEEHDPMNTGALESSLWEIETLQSHYHPNVATLAKIISDQFTKPSYNLEDFLDHSYAGLIESELGKDELKKPPVVEFEIPKRIFTDSEAELGEMGQLMTQVLGSR